MLSTWTRRLLPLLILLGAFAIALLMVNSRAELPHRESVAAVPVVAILTAHPGTVAATVKSRGTASAMHEIELVSEVSGRVVWVAPEFVEGGQVREGEALLRIDPIDYEVALSEARAALASAKFSLAEVKVVVMRAAIEEAEARVVAAEDRLRQAEIDLQNTVIKAPFDAIVDIKRTDLGHYVQTGTAVMKLLSTDIAELRLPVLNADLPFVRYGQRPDGNWYEAVLTGRFGKRSHSWRARLVRMEKRVDSETRVSYLVAQVDHPYDIEHHGQALRVGQFVEAAIGGAKLSSATRVPRSALHDRTYVYLVEHGVLRRQMVDVLRHEQDSVILGEGLSKGDQVVLSRLDLMLEGMPVAAEDESAASVDTER